MNSSDQSIALYLILQVSPPGAYLQGNSALGTAFDAPAGNAGKDFYLLYNLSGGLWMEG